MNKKKIELSLVVVLVLLLTYGLGYWTGSSHPQKVPCVIVAMDTADSLQSSGRVEYEPYFTKRNLTPDKVR